MAFRFALATLLRLRQSLERQRALDLRRATLRVMQAEDSVQKLDKYLIASDQCDFEAMRNPNPAACLHFADRSRREFAALRERLNAEREQYEQLRQQAMIEYRRVHRERESLESLRDQANAAYQQEELRRQQNDIDEAYLMRLAHPAKN